MNLWLFVIAAYGAAAVGIGGLIVWASIAMRRAERRLEKSAPQ